MKSHVMSLVLLLFGSCVGILKWFLINCCTKISLDCPRSLNAAGVLFMSGINFKGIFGAQERFAVSIF